MWHDIIGVYSFDEATSHSGSGLLSGLRLQVGIRNVFDKLPAFDAFNQPYYYSYFGDIRLRDYTVTLTKSF
jgi:outer membrane receptor protein involved in Fe transport